AVLVAEEGERPSLDRVVVGHLLGPDLGVGADVRVRLVLDVAQRRLVDWAAVAEVETQALRRDERAGLLHMLAEPATEGRMQEMRRGVMEAGRLPPPGLRSH